MGQINTFFTIIFLSGVLLGACQAQKTAAEQFAYQQIRFGSGGGFTGSVTTYTLNPNGELSSINSLTKESKLEKKLLKKDTDALFKRAEELNLESITFNHPGNLYYFIETNKEAVAHRITWGSPEHEVPQAILDFYQLLQSKIADQ